MRLVGHEPQAPRPAQGGRRDKRGAPPGGWPRPGARSTICSRTAGKPGALDEVRAGHEAETRRTRPSPGGRGGQGCPWTGRRRAGRSLGYLGLTTKKMRTHPTRGGRPGRRADPPSRRVARRARPVRDKRTAVVLGNAGLHHAKGLERSLCLRSGPGAHHAHPHAPLRPRPRVPPSTHKTPPEPAPPIPARSPRRTPSRSSPPTSPTTPSTTTSSTPQSHHHTPISFNSSQTSMKKLRTRHNTFGAILR